MEPLLDEDTKGGGDERNKETQYPKSVDSGKHSRFLERRSSKIRDSRVDKIPVE